MVGVVTILFLWRWRKQYGVVADFNRRHVLVTGCDYGFGNMLVKRLDEMGVNVFAGCLSETGSEQLDKETSARVTTLKMDVASTDSIQKAFEVVNSKLNSQKVPGLWGVVNNAGITGPVAISEWLSKEDYCRVLDVNTFGMIETTRIFLPLVLKVRGRIVNIASILGRIAAAPIPAYVVSKYAVEGYSDNLRRELYHRGVSVHIIEPGFFRTNMASSKALSSARESFNKLPDNLKKYFGQPFLENKVAATKRILQTFTSPKTHLVIDAYIHALTSKCPNHRYIVGNDANYVFRVLWNLPVSIADFILSKDQGIPEAEAFSK